MFLEVSCCLLGLCVLKIYWLYICAWRKTLVNIIVKGGWLCCIFGKLTFLKSTLLQNYMVVN